MYYVNEKIDNENFSHPLANMFSISDRGQLVLVDITGASEQVSKVKMNELAKWIEKGTKKYSEL